MHPRLYGLRNPCFLTQREKEEVLGHLEQKPQLSHRSPIMLKTTKFATSIRLTFKTLSLTIFIFAKTKI